MSLMKGLVPWSRNDSLARNDEERSPFLSLQNEMNRMFDGFFRGFGLQPFQGFEGGFGGLSGLRSEEDDQEYRLTAEMPGIGEKDLEVKLSGDTLTIRAQKEESQEDEKRSFKQRSSRSFYQSLTLPAFAQLMQEVSRVAAAVGRELVVPASAIGVAP